MNPFLRLDSAALWHIAGWTMVHFLWLGTLVGLAAGACRLVLRRASPNARYMTAGASLAILAALPLAIAGWLAVDSRPVPEGARGGSYGASENTRDPRVPQLHVERTDILAELESQGPALAGEALVSNADVEAFAGAAGPFPSPALEGRRILLSAIESCVAVLPWIWFVGTPLTLIFLATGIVGTERLRRASQPVGSGPLIEMGAQLATSLRVGRRVIIATCDRVAAPVLVGILRPMILLPPAALTGWSPDEVEMVLLHELAHVRRWDNLANFVQRLVESLLFFHPAVWLISSWMRREREACCDALVVTCTRRPHAYAELLVALAAQMPRSVLFHPAASSAIAAGPLRNRIRYILQLEDDPMLVTGKSFALVLAGLLAAATFAVLYLPSRGQAEESGTEVTENAEESGENRAKENLAESAFAHTPDADEQAKSEPVNSAVDPEPNYRVEVEEVPVGDEDVMVVRGSEDDVNAFVNVMEGDKNREPQDEPRVLATIPPDRSLEEIFRAADEARAKNLYVDVRYTGNGTNLVVVPEPTEADWPAMLGDPPRKDRVIADKAWQRLGLKLVPASPLEITEFSGRRTAGPIKILGGNLPKGLPLPAFLRRVGDRALEGFDDLHAWLLSQENKRPMPVKVYAFANGHEYLFEVGPVDDEEAAPAHGPKPKFPSLEDQKLADLAWRMLQLELEPASDEDLKGVRALGYQGGVLIAGKEYSDGERQNDGGIWRGDILVGLHVWPTTSLKDVAEILQRDDLANLNPLKFYVVRSGEVVITGRISVRSSGTQPGGLSQVDAAERDSKNSAASAGNVSAYVRQSGDEPPAADENEIKVLQDHIKTLQSQFDRIDALFKAGRRGGNASTRALAAYELAVAKGELALMQGQRAQALKSFHEAQSQAEDAFKAMSADYEAGNTTYDVMLLTSKNLADIKRKIIQLQQGSASVPFSRTTSNALRDDSGAYRLSSQSPAAGQSNESLSVLRKMVQREKQKFEGMVRLADVGKVTETEVATQKADYEISMERLRQAERALEYYKALVALAAADYEAALNASKNAPGVVPKSELRKLQLKVHAAEAKFKELSE